MRESYKITAYRNGVLLGEKSAKKWATELGVHPQKIWECARRKMAMGEFLFEYPPAYYYTHAIYKKSAPPKISLSDAARMQRRDHLTYGEIQKRQYAESVRVNRQKFIGLNLTSMREREELRTG